MKKVTRHARWVSVCAVLGVGAVTAQQPSQNMDAVLVQLKQICQSDIQRLCPNVQPGGGRIIKCMSEHQDEISPTCKQAIAQADQTVAQGQGANPPQPPMQSQAATGPRQGGAPQASVMGPQPTELGFSQ